MLISKKHIVAQFIFLLALYISAEGQTVQVLSSKGKPVEAAVVSGEKYSATTNKYGEFSLSPFLNDDSLKVSHMAFIPKKVALSQLLKNRKVILYPKIFKTGTVRVSTEKGELDKEQITISPAEKAKFNNLAELIEKKSTIRIKSYGGEGSLKTVSVRGMSGDNTLVLFNETKVNDLRSGSFDFSLIGINSIDEAEYYKNGVDGFSAAGGIVKLISGIAPASNSFLIGSKINELLGQTFYFKSGLVKDKNSLSVNLERSYSRNNYSYKYEGQTRERENADYSRFFASASFNKFFKKGFVKLYSHISTMNNGLPGFVASNNYNSSHARSSSKNFLTVGNIFYKLLPKIALKSSVSYNRQNFTITDPYNELYIFRNEDKSSINEFQFNNSLSIKLRSIQIKTGAHLLYGKMSLLNPDINSAPEKYYAHRSFGSIFVSVSKLITTIPFCKSFKPYAGGSYSVSKENFINDKTAYSYFSLKSGFIVVPEFTENLSLEFYYADNFREPNFTEIYYSRMFSDTRLKGEKYKTINLTFDYSPASNFSGALSFYRIDGKDKIVWLPTRLALQIPRNFRSIKSEGVEFSSNFRLLNNKLTFNLIYVYNSTINTYYAGEGDEAFKKQLVYTPKNRLSFGTTFNIAEYSASIDVVYTDKSYYTSDNNPRFVLPAYALTDLSLSRSFNLNQYSSRITFNVYNLFNTNYFVIQSYPMPRRSFTLDIQFGVF